MGERRRVYDYFFDTVAGHFDVDQAERFGEGTTLGRGGVVSVQTGESHRHEALYLTAEGRWVQERWSDVAGTTGRCIYVRAEDARQWLVRNEDWAVIERLFGPVLDEAGPLPDGPVRVRLDDSSRIWLNQVAADEEISPVEVIRRLVAAARDAGLEEDSERPFGVPDAPLTARVRSLLGAPPVASE